MQLAGPYVGVVVSNADPAKLGRVKVSVPHVYGVEDTTVAPIGITDLPWAIPAGLPAGGTTASGGMDWLPDPGDQVLVFFFDGEPEKPVWMWMMQTLDQADSFPLHHYSDKSAKGKPDRAGLTRYGHTFEINKGSVLASTKSGYQLFLLDGDSGEFNGNITLQTPRAQSLEIDDDTQSATLNINRDVYFNVGLSWQVQCDDLDFESMAGDFRFTIGKDWNATVAENMNLDVGIDLTNTIGGVLTDDVSLDWDATVGNDFNLDVTASINMKFAALNLGAGASEPYVLGNQLLTLFNTLLIWLAGHTHGNGNFGSPTAPPLVPPQTGIMPLLSTILSSTIKGQ